MVARIVIAVFLNIHLLSALNGNSDEPVLSVVGVIVVLLLKSH